jgi:hypothetical protein
MAWNYSPPNLCLPSSWDYSMSHCSWQWIVFILKGMSPCGTVLVTTRARYYKARPFFCIYTLSTISCSSMRSLSETEQMSDPCFWDFPTSTTMSPNKAFILYESLSLRYAHLVTENGLRHHKGQLKIFYIYMIPNLLVNMVSLLSLKL